MLLIGFGNTETLVILKKAHLYRLLILNLWANMLAAHYRHIYLLTVNSIK